MRDCTFSKFNFVEIYYVCVTCIVVWETALKSCWLFKIIRAEKKLFSHDLSSYSILKFLGLRITKVFLM